MTPAKQLRAMTEESIAKDQVRQKIIELRDEMDFVRNQAVAMIAKSQRTFKEKISETERSAAAQLDDVGRSTEHHALGEAEAQIARQALFKAAVMEAASDDLDIANVRRRLHCRRRRLIWRLLQRRLMLKLRLLRLQRENPKELQAQAQADARVEAEVAALRQDAEEAIAEAEARETRIAVAQLAAEQMAVEVRTAAEQHAQETAASWLKAKLSTNCRFEQHKKKWTNMWRIGTGCQPSMSAQQQISDLQGTIDRKMLRPKTAKRRRLLRHSRKHLTGHR